MTPFKAMLLPGFFIAGPLEQFQIRPLIPLHLFGVDISFTNASLWMLLGVGLVVASLCLSLRRADVVPTTAQSIAEMLHDFIAAMVKSMTGSAGMPYFPYVFSLFCFILAANVLGLAPSLFFLPESLHSFTPTSHIVVTATMALATMALVIAIGLAKNGLRFFKLFAPSGLAWPILIFVIPIEVISFLARPLSLSVRLFANMLAGHVLLKLFAGFCVSMLGFGGIAALSALLPFVAILGVTLLEILVALIQAYVFAILTCVYLNDALHPGH